MAMKWQGESGRTLRIRPWWRPMAYSAASFAAIAMLFNPLPAAAAPPAAPPAPAVPDAGSRPLAQGPLVLPGQQAATTPPTTSPISTPGVTLSPVMQKIEKGRTDLAALGELLTKAKQEVDLVTAQVTAAQEKITQTSAAVGQAQTEVAKAAVSAVHDEAALPPGSIGSGLSDLDSLARINRGDSATQQAASRQLAIAQAAYTSALTEQQAAQAQLTKFTADRDKLQKDLDKKTTAQQKLEQENAAAIAASESAQAAQDAQVGADYLAGENAGRGADARAVAALKFALAQRGKNYKWSEEGPYEYDCSGLMYAAYRSPGAGNFPLTRVSRDQYYQTRNKAVDRYSLLPGDLLFFSSSNSWKQIHHVAMYAGDGMMVEAPRARLKVRLVPVRWTRLFGATRIYGSVEGVVEGPNLGTPDPADEPGNGSTTRPTTKPTKTVSPKPTTTKTTKPGTPVTTKPTTTTKPGTPATTTTGPKPTDTPTTTPATTAAPTTTASQTSAVPTKEESPESTGSATKTSENTKAPESSKAVSASAAAAAVSKSSGS
jgi:peptidoglycan DL-endopeptidase CwlO